MSVKNEKNAKHWVVKVPPEKLLETNLLAQHLAALKISGVAAEDLVVSHPYGRNPLTIGVTLLEHDNSGEVGKLIHSLRLEKQLHALLDPLGAEIISFQRHISSQVG